MPELPEVETVCQGLARYIIGNTITSIVTRCEALRIKVPENLSTEVAHRKVIQVKRRAKYILIYLQGKKILVVHLGMSGKMVLFSCAQDYYDKHDHVIFQFADGKEIIFNDQRKFGMIFVTTQQALKQHKLFCKLGREPLEEDFNGSWLCSILQGRNRAIKTAIMHSNIVVGVGNIYACEALFKAGIRPDRSTKTLTEADCHRLANAIKQVLRQAIEAGGTTLKDYIMLSGEQGYFQQQLNVYGREGLPCFCCGDIIQRVKHNNRSSFFCLQCQK